MASMKAYLEKLSVSKMTALQEKLAIPVQSNFDEIISIIYQHKDYKIFCQNERSKDAKKAYQNIMKMTNYSKDAHQIRMLQCEFLEMIGQKETQLPILFIEDFISNENSFLLSLNKINTDIDSINNLKPTEIENQNIGKVANGECHEDIISEFTDKGQDKGIISKSTDEDITSESSEEMPSFVSKSSHLDIEIHEEIEIESKSQCINVNNAEILETQEIQETEETPIVIPTYSKMKNVVHNVPTYSCFICDKIYTQNHNLKTHIRNVHESGLEDDNEDSDFSRARSVKKLDFIHGGKDSSTSENYYKINKTKVLDVTKDVTNNVTNTEDEKIENKIADDNFSKTFGESDSTIESSKNTSTAINISGEHSDDNVKEPFLRENDVPNNTSASQENEIKYLIYSVEEKDSVLNLKSEKMKMTKEVRNLIIGIVESNEVFYKCKRCSKKFSTKSDISKHIEHSHLTESMNFKPAHGGQNPQKDASVNGFENSTPEILEKEVWEKFATEKIVNSETSYQCKECNKIFTKKDRMKQHITFPGITKCKICQNKFVHLKAHLRHVHEYDMEIPSWLEEKKEKLELWARVVTKIVKNGDETIYQCNECTKNFSERFKILGHIRSNKKKCNICDKFFVHLRDHTKKYHIKITYKKLFKCKTCDKKFQTDSQKDSHKAFVHKGISRFCEYCSKQFDRIEAKTRHIKTVHEGVKPVKCNFCDETFRHYSSRGHHEKKFHGVVEQCDLCGKTFNKSQINFHIKSHSENRPRIRNNVCPHCGKSFWEGKNMNSHINDVHKEIRRYICELCSYSSNRKYNLRLHQRKVHEVKTNPELFPKLQCHICDKYFNLKEKLAEHIRRIHNNKKKLKLKCEIDNCDKYYTTSHNFKEHMAKSHGKFQEFKCDLCTRSFSASLNLKRHKAAMHNNEDSGEIDGQKYL